MQRKIVLIGGSGFIGKYVAKEFLQEPSSKICIASSMKRKDLSTSLPSNLDLSRADITSQDSVLEVLDGADTVVNLVGIMHETIVNGKKYTFDNVQHLGARNVAAACQELKIRSLVHISAIGANPDSQIPYARTKGLGELAVREKFPEATIIRPSLVFGPEDDFFNRFAKLAKFLPFLPVFGGGTTKFQPVYVSDLAKAIVTSSSPSSIARGRIVEVGGPTVYQYKELMKLVLSESGVRRTIISLPWTVGLIQGFFLEKFPPNLFTLTRDQVKLLNYDNVVKTPNTLTLQDLGIKPTPAEDILKTYLRKSVK